MVDPLYIGSVWTLKGKPVTVLCEGKTRSVSLGKVEGEREEGKENERARGKEGRTHLVLKDTTVISEVGS